MEYKIIFTGSMGAGKTTAIASVSETPPINTDVANTDKSVDKPTTTVGLDYGVVTLENGDRLRLFGTPGQERFGFLWKILAQDALGIIILMNNAGVDPLGQLASYLNGFAGQLDKIPCVIGVGRYIENARPTLDEYADLTLSNGYLIPVVAVDVRSADDVNMLIDVLLTQIEARAE
jgi:uncharacterized protein